MEDLPRTIRHARVYFQWTRQRLIVHDGTRWRRVSDPWRVNIDRPIPVELNRPDEFLLDPVRLDLIRALPVAITIDAPGYEHTPVERLEYLGLTFPRDDAFARWWREWNASAPVPRTPDGWIRPLTSQEVAEAAWMAGAAEIARRAALDKPQPR